MAQVERPLAVGVDGAKGGWIAALAYPRSTELRLAADIAAVDAFREEAVVAIDVPIGLPEDVELRPCDRAAREVLGPLWRSVFAPPARYLFGSTSFAEVQRRVNERGTARLSRQAFGLLSRIEDVDRFVRSRPDSEEWLVEVHPELCFRALNGAADLPAKATALGSLRRTALVSTYSPDYIGAVERALPATPLTDVLDAYAALWTALRVRARKSQVLGGERDAEGVVMRMVV